MKRPTDEQLDIAIMWLQSNTGDNGESEACQAVAVWIDYVASESMLRAAARKTGVPIAALREQLRELAQR